MRETVNELLSLRASGGTKRWHTLPVINGQTVAEHSGQCLTILFMLHPSPSMNLVRALLWHDSAERAVGDVPSPALRANDIYRDAYESAELDFLMRHHPMAYHSMANLDAEERAWLKAVDRLELILFMSDQAMLGNQHATIVLNRALGYVRDDRTTPREVIDFMVALEDEGSRSFA